MGITERKNKHLAGIAPSCHSCIVNQARSTARFAGLTEDQTERVIAIAETWLEKSKTMPLLAQHVIRYVGDAIIQEQGKPPYFDIYSEVKEASNALSLKHATILQKKIADSRSPLETALQIAAAGNIIDFGAKGDGSLNLVKELQLLTAVPFERYDVESFRTALHGASTLLYICDNAGEIVFDLLFMKELHRLYPDLQIVAAVRDKPIINDATLEDAKAVGLNSFVTTISSGSVYPGTILREATEEFQKLFESAGVILAKGQGNFETLQPVADERLFFLLRIKCEYMAALSKVKKDNLMLMQGKRN
jgi:damage-control phosphatase, subfamily I